MAKYYKLRKFYDAFDALDSNSNLVVAEHYEWNTFCDAFDFNSHLVGAEHYESDEFFGALYPFYSNAHLVL